MRATLCLHPYPTPTENLNLQNIKMLQNSFRGILLDTLIIAGNLQPSHAVGLGAVLIEKHFTLDASRIGFDNQMASEPDGMQKLVDACRKTKLALGGMTET